MLVETCGFQPCSTKVQHREWQPPGTANHQQVRLSKGKKNSKNFQADFGDLYCYQLNESDHISSTCNPEVSGHFEDNEKTWQVHDSPVQSIQISQVLCIGVYPMFSGLCHLFWWCTSKTLGSRCHKQLDFCSLYYHFRKRTFMDWHMMFETNTHRAKQLESEGWFENSFKKHT